MASNDQTKWNSRYSKDIGNLTPSELLTLRITDAPLGRALDIACGNGKNSIFLAKNGFEVEAVDISSVALEHLKQKEPSIHTRCEDLDHFTIANERYSLIVNANFLDRRLFPMIENGLVPGGVLIFESFSGNKTSKYCLGPNELLNAFSILRIIYYEEKKLHDSEKFEKSVQLVAVKEEKTR